MTKILRQEDLHPDGFKCIGGKLTPAFTSPAFNCADLNGCPISSLSDVDTVGIFPNATLRWSGTSFVPSSSIDSATQSIDQASHGFVMPPEGVIPVYNDAGTWTLADSTTLDHTHEAFIVDIIGADDFVIQQSGFVNATSHGLTIGEKYYVQDNGSLSTTPATGIQDIAVTPVDIDTLLLFDNYAFTIPVPDTKETVEIFTSLSTGSSVTVAGTIDITKIIKVYRNGLFQIVGAGNEYEISGNVITFTTAFSGNENVQVIYYA